MRKLFLIIMFIPLIAMGNEVQKGETLTRLQKLCKNSVTPELRQLYCKLANDYRKAKKASSKKESTA